MFATPWRDIKKAQQRTNKQTLPARHPWPILALFKLPFGPYWLEIQMGVDFFLKENTSVMRRIVVIWLWKLEKWGSLGQTGSHNKPGMQEFRAGKFSFLCFPIYGRLQFNKKCWHLSQDIHVLLTIWEIRLHKTKLNSQLIHYIYTYTCIYNTDVIYSVVRKYLHSDKNFCCLAHWIWHQTGRQL